MPEFLSFLPTSQAYLIIVIQQASGIPGVLLGTWMVETSLGRRWTAAIGFGLSGVFGILFLLKEEFFYVFFIQVLFITTILYFCTFLGYSAIFTIGPESYPTQVRSTGYGIVSILARIGGACGPLVAGGLLSRANGRVICLGLFSGTFIFSGLMVMLMKETRLKARVAEDTKE